MEQTNGFFSIRTQTHFSRNWPQLSHGRVMKTGFADAISLAASSGERVARLTTSSEPWTFLSVTVTVRVGFFFCLCPDWVDWIFGPGFKFFVNRRDTGMEVMSETGDRGSVLDMMNFFVRWRKGFVGEQLFPLLWS